MLSKGYLSGPKAAKELNGNVNRFFRVMFRTSEPDDFPGGFPLQDNESFLADLDPPRSRLLSEQVTFFIFFLFSKFK